MGIASAPCVVHLCAVPRCRRRPQYPAATSGAGRCPHPGTAHRPTGRDPSIRPLASAAGPQVVPCTRTVDTAGRRGPVGRAKAVFRGSRRPATDPDRRPTMTRPDEDLAFGAHLSPEERDREAPDGDVVEQARSANPADEPDEVRRGLEVAEWDAVEQATIVDLNDEY